MGDDEDFWEEEARSEAAMEAAGEAYVEEQARRYIEDNQVELAAEFLESNREQAIEDFRRDRLRQYYDDNPLVADKALGCLNLAKTLLTSLPRASVVFSVSAAEVTFKNVLLRPILSGFVHDEDLAEIIVEGATDKQSNKLNDFLANLLDRFAKFPMKKFKRVGVKATYWEELAIASKIRNKVVHDGDDATPRRQRMPSKLPSTPLTPFCLSSSQSSTSTSTLRRQSAARTIAASSQRRRNSREGRCVFCRT